MAALSKELADERARLAKLEMELTEKEQAARQMAAQLAEKAKIEAAYQSLKDELLEYQTKARRLIAATHLLKAQADEKEAARRMLAEWSEPETAAEDQRIAPASFYDALTLLPRLPEEELQEIIKKRPPESPRRHPDVICFSIDDGPVHHQQVPQTIAQFAAEGHRVFYLSATPFQPSEASPCVRVGIIRENVYEVQLAAESQSNASGDGSEGKHQAALLQAVDELRHAFYIDEAIGYVMTPAWGNVALEAQKLWRWRLVYDCPGEGEKLPQIAGPLLDLELRLVQRCD